MNTDKKTPLICVHSRLSAAQFDLVLDELENLQQRSNFTAELLEERRTAIHTLALLAGSQACSAEQLVRLMKIYSDGQLLWVRLSASRQSTLLELASLARDTQLVSSLLAGVKRPPNLNCVG